MFHLLDCLMSSAPGPKTGDKKHYEFHYSPKHEQGVKESVHVAEMLDLVAPLSGNLLMPALKDGDVDDEEGFVKDQDAAEGQISEMEGRLEENTLETPCMDGVS